MYAVLGVGTKNNVPGATSGAEYPDYIAFRTSGDDGRLLTVVAALEPENGARFPWATWYHELAVDGDLKKVPCSYVQLGMDTMIGFIKLGRALPPDFIVKFRNHLKRQKPSSQFGRRGCWPGVRTNLGTLTIPSGEKPAVSLA